MQMRTVFVLHQVWGRFFVEPSGLSCRCLCFLTGMSAAACCVWQRYEADLHTVLNESSF